MTNPVLHLKDDSYSVKKVWGSENWLVNDAYCMKILSIKKRFQCSIHYHQNKDETFYVAKGVVLIEIPHSHFRLHRGDSLRIKPTVPHRFTGITNVTIIEASTHHEDSDSYRITKSKKLCDKEFKLIRKVPDTYNAARRFLP